MANRYAKPLNTLRGARAIQLKRNGEVYETPVPGEVSDAIEVYAERAPEEMTRDRLLDAIAVAGEGGFIRTRELERLTIALGAELAMTDDPYMRMCGTKALLTIHGRRESRQRWVIRRIEQAKAYARRNEIDRNDFAYRQGLKQSAADADRHKRRDWKIDGDMKIRAPK